jgi:hypothetical protein
MAFEVFPEAPSGPLSIGPGDTLARSFPEKAGVTPPELLAVYLRIVMLRADCGPPGMADCGPPGGPDPTFRLRAGTGNPVDLRDDGYSVFVRDRPPEEAGARVAKAQLFFQVDNVYLIKIFIDGRGSTWQLHITNNADGERKFTWVVADNLSESEQPWLNLPQNLSFNAEIGKKDSHFVGVRNLGTGNLEISGGGLTGSSSFSLDDFPPAIVPNHCERLVIRFHAPATSGPTTGLYTATSNDKQAAEFTEHNNHISLVAKTTNPEGPAPDPEPDPLEGGRCRICSCPRFFGTGAHPVLGRICRSHNCGHDVDDHFPPQ